MLKAKLTLKALQILFFCKLNYCRAYGTLWVLGCGKLSSVGSVSASVQLAIMFSLPNQAYSHLSASKATDEKNKCICTVSNDIII